MYKVEPFLESLNLTRPIAGHHKAAEFLEHVDSGLFRPDLLVVNTCLEQGLAGAKLTARAIDTMYDLDLNPVIFCTIHKPVPWFKAQPLVATPLRRAMKANRLHLITLSEHVKNKAEEELQAFLKSHPVQSPPPVRVLPAVFASNDPAFTYHGDDLPGGTVALAIQGNLETKRRNYGQVISGIAAAEAAAVPELPPLQLRLVGSRIAKIAIPKQLSSIVRIKSGLDFQAFYTYLAESSFLIPAFATDSYLTEKASSTIPLSEILAVPLVADKKILQSYSYLSRDCVWLREEKETETEAVLRFLLDPAFKEIRKEKVATLRKHRDLLVQENRRMVASWIDEFVTGVPSSEGGARHRQVRISENSYDAAAAAELEPRHNGGSSPFLRKRVPEGDAEKRDWLASVKPFGYAALTTITESEDVDRSTSRESRASETRSIQSKVGKSRRRIGFKF